MILYYKCKRTANNNALTNLHIFPTLYEIFKDANSKGSLSEENPILRNARINSINAKQFLSDIENTLNSLKVNQWSSKEINSLRNRLTSDKTSDSFSLLSELKAYSSLVRYVGLENVTYQHSAENDKKPDFKIDVNGKEIIFELISLHERVPILRIKDVFKDLCENLFSTIKEGKNYYIRLNIDQLNYRQNGKKIRKERLGM
jgi:hypothetical protein